MVMKGLQAAGNQAGAVQGKLQGARGVSTTLILH